MIKLKYFPLLLAVLFVAACQGPKEQQQALPEDPSQSEEMTGVPTYQIGDQVPHDFVCMVNNAYMGKKQFEVPFGGKTYYGCCNMCVERIPIDKEARTAVDPYSSKEVDKSEAFIVMVSARGDVVYFENEQNYKQFLTAQ